MKKTNTTGHRGQNFIGYLCKMVKLHGVTLPTIKTAALFFLKYGIDRPIFLVFYLDTKIAYMKNFKSCIDMEFSLSENSIHPHYHHNLNLKASLDHG